jgi:tetratricopeptide (TPR) repeat protein
VVLKDENSHFEEHPYPISSKVLLHHYPDMSKDRSNYAHLLNIRLKEHPKDPFSYIYIIQDLFSREKYKECLDFILSTAFGAIESAPDALFIPNLYLHMGDCYGMLGDFILAERAYKRGIAAFPLYRENYLALAAHLIHHQRYLEAKETLYDCLQKTKRFYD